MIAFEQTASDPKRLFQSSFQLVEEEKFRRRAYPTLLKLESTLLNAIIKFEQGKPISPQTNAKCSYMQVKNMKEQLC